MSSSFPSQNWLDAPMNAAEFLSHNGHAYRNPKHPMHALVSAEFRRLATLEAGPGAVGPGGEVVGAVRGTESLLRKP